MPPDTVKVDRSTKWGNPAIVGPGRIAAECVYLYVLMLGGYVICEHGTGDRQREALKVLNAEKAKGWPKLRGKNLACWCALDKPCHADVLLYLVNKRDGAPGFDLNAYLARFGWRVEGGYAVRL